jgi:hypothetical protein
MAKVAWQTKRSRVMKRAGIPMPLAPPAGADDPADWWSFTIITDTPEDQKRRRARFLREVRGLFQKGVRALGADEALQIWKNAPPEGRKGPHDPEGDTLAIAMYDKKMSAGATERKAKAAAVEVLAQRPKRKNIQRASNQKRIRSLLEKRDELSLQEEKRRRLAKAYFPAGVLLAPDNKD